MNTRFCLRPYDKLVSEKLEHAGILRPIARALSARGVTSSDDLIEDWTALLPPASLEGTQLAAELLADAIQNNKRITVVADYDCDGATACAIAVRGLAMLGTQAQFIVPDRFKLGYGLTPAIVEAAAHTHKPDVIITVDNGIASVEGVARARELGIDVIITDHHLPGDSLPEAACIVNPNVGESTFQSKSLAGCGVMFYVLMALRTELRNRGVFDRATQPRLDKLSDLVALGTVADVVKLDHNNRVLVAQGLNRIRRGLACPGINALFAVAGRDPAAATARDFAFGIAPRINAAGRLTEMGVGIECLLTESFDEAQSLALELDSLNRERRELEGTMQLDANALVSHMDWEHRATVTLFEPDWHQGVVGLVASRVKEKINRPIHLFRSPQRCSRRQRYHQIHNGISGLLAIPFDGVTPCHTFRRFVACEFRWTEERDNRAIFLGDGGDFGRVSGNEDFTDVLRFFSGFDGISNQRFPVQVANVFARQSFRPASCKNPGMNYFFSIHIFLSAASSAASTRVKTCSASEKDVR